MNPAHYLWPIVVVAILVALWLLLPRRRTKPSLPYNKRKSLLTDGELKFYRALQKAIPVGTAVFVKVRLMDVVSVPDNAWQQYGAPGSGMHLDFVLAIGSTIEPRLVIELDDKSHLRPEVQKRDAFKNAALDAAGVPLLRVKATTKYDAVELRATVTQAMAG